MIDINKFDISEKDKRKNKIWKLLPYSIWSNSKILDCASGDGRKGIQYYMSMGVDPKNVVAVDVNDQSLEKLENLGVETYCLDLEKSNISNIIKNKKFDIILCAETLEHVSTKAEEKIFNSFMKLLNAWGYIIISFPNNMVIEKPVKKYGHIRQPNVNKIVKRMSILFNRYKVIRFKKKKKGNSESIIIFREYR